MDDDGLIERVNRIIRGLRTHFAHRAEVKQRILTGECDLDAYWNELLGDDCENATAA